MPPGRPGHHPPVDEDVPMATVSEIRRYPVKSMLGEDLDECPVGPAGMAGDRAYAVIDGRDGQVASAKNPRKWGALLHFGAAFVEEPVFGQPPPPVVITFPDGRRLASDDPGIDAALSEALGRPVHLAAEAPAGRTFEEVWPDIEGLAPQEFIERTTVGHEDSGEPVSSIELGMAAPPGTFFDLSVLHVMTTATLRALGAADPGADFDVRRYRPNVLVAEEGGTFSENDWVGRRVAIGDSLQIRVTLPTMRCVMTTLAQDGLGPDRRTLRAIAAHNRIDIPGLGTWACAGVYADVLTGGRVRVGDPVRAGGTV